MKKRRDDKKIRVNRWTEFLRWTGLIFLVFGVCGLILGLLGTRGLFGRARPDTSMLILNTSLILLPVAGACILALKLMGRKLFSRWMIKEFEKGWSNPKAKPEPLTEEKRKSGLARVCALFRALSFFGAVVFLGFLLWPDVPETKNFAKALIGMCLTGFGATFALEAMFTRDAANGELPGRYALYLLSMILGIPAFWLGLAEMSYLGSSGAGFWLVCAGALFGAASLVTFVFHWAFGKEPPDGNAQE